MNKYIKKEYSKSELTSKLIRFAYDIYDELGYGLPEKVYQRSFGALLEKNKLKYSKEKYGKIIFEGKIVGRYYVDFVVEKVAIEFKIRNEIYQKDINQLLNYIKSEQIPVGLIIAPGKEGIKIKRLAN
ncbi:MAG: hypothetical protein Athens101428_270 [Candidatus Berkelbacteria bacterium Athens1014_28]|uniref:GxxExxY protein n=1 Tax=Candidatus Berkelbacteria bacterium Athens1014_28 TaxID=2017145 RepID=A0A554LNS6_9BACT|nr:MAG: hypothetical protein Athens101428_270 [Candidatus Berkelbacteria bacterium Athens1014_28]